MKYSLLFCMFLSSCVTTKIKEKELSPFPPKPSLTEYATKPIISSINENYEVSSEFVGNSIKLKKYVDKIEAWKQLNNIP